MSTPALSFVVCSQGFEPLNETQDATYGFNGDPVQRLGPGIVVRGTHVMSIAPPAHAPIAYRDVQEEMFAPPLVRFAVPAEQSGTVCTWGKGVSNLGRLHNLKTVRLRTVVRFDLKRLHSHERAYPRPSS